MPKVNRFLFCICMFCLSLPILAQQPDAKDILVNTARNFRNAAGVKATFSVEAPGGTSVGEICMKGDKFLLKADGVTTWFDGHTQWSYVISNDEVNVSVPTREELQSINPYALLSLYNHGYNPKLAKTDNPRYKSLYKVVLTADNRNKDLQSIALYLTKDSLRPVRISMTQRGGETVVIVVDSYQAGLSYPDSFFVFNKKAYPTAEIIDLR